MWWSAPTTCWRPERIEALHARGIRVPAEVAVVGFDNDANVGFSLTTVHQPVYLLGRKAAALALALVRGAQVPKNEILSTELVVRRSCGCFVADVTNSVAQTAVGSSQPPATLLAAQKEMTLTEMLRAARRFAVGVSPEWPERLFNSFVRDITGEAHGEFLSVLDSVLVQEWLEHQRIEPWQNVLSVLRRQLLPCLTTQEMFAAAENLWHQARVLVTEAAERMHAYQQEQRTRQALRLMNVNATYFRRTSKAWPTRLRRSCRGWASIVVTPWSTKATPTRTAAGGAPRPPPRNGRGWCWPTMKKNISNLKPADCASRPNSSSPRISFRTIAR